MATIEETYKTPADRLRFLMGRETRQKDLAALLGVSGPYISTVISGEKGLTPENWLKLAEYFGVTLDWLLCRQGAPKDWPTTANEKPIQLSKHAAEAVQILDSLPRRKRDEVLGVMRSMSFHVQAATLDVDQAAKRLTDKLAVGGVMLPPTAIENIRAALDAFASDYRPDDNG
jgi:plasmid maintenance system antidote protein VapI